METFLNQDADKKLISLSIFYVGSAKSQGSIPLDWSEDTIWKLKKRLLNKLKFEGYNDQALQESIRIFTSKGMEIGEDDISALLYQ